MILLEIEPLDLGQDVRAVGLNLMDGDREPARGEGAARVWSLVLPAIAAKDPWALDFFSHLERVREFCDSRQLEYREASKRSLVIATPQSEALLELFKRFEAETFGLRAGSRLTGGDSALENELGRQGVDAYHSAYHGYSFCAVCDFENGSVTLLSDSLWASEVVRRTRPAVNGIEIDVRLVTRIS